MIIEKLYNMCVEAGYNGSLDEFVCKLESIILKENKQIEKVSEEDIMKVSGGANLGQKISAGALSALMLGTSTGFAETLKSNQSKNEVITNTQKSPKQKEYIVNKHDKKNLKNILFKVFGIGTVVGLPLLALAAICKIKTAEKFEDAFDEFNKAIGGFGKNSNEEIIKICEEFEKQLLKELNTRKIDINNWNLVGLKVKTDKEAVKIVLEHIIAGLNTLNDNLDENKDAQIKGAVDECIQNLNSYLDTVKQEINKEHEGRQKKEDRERNMEEENNEQENWYNYDEETNTITVEGKKEKPTEITEEMVQNMAKKYSLSEENKINLVLKNCVVRKDAFVEFKFIDNLTIDQGATVDQHGFSGIYSVPKITNLNINEGATVKENGFYGAFNGITIMNLNINEGATVDRCGFYQATITNLTINENAKVGMNGFCQATIIGTTNISDDVLNDYGALYISQKLLDDLTKHDANSKTITIKGKKEKPTEITEEMVQKMAERYSLSEENKINLVLGNCVVKEDAFNGCEFIDNLTIDQGATVEKNGFRRATITDLTINEGATVEQYGFRLKTITNLTINDGATVEQYGFFRATITNLTINDSATVEQYGFGEAKITDLTINKGATVKECEFRQATITNLTIKDGVTVEENGFRQAKITDLTINKGAVVNGGGFCQATIIGTTNISADVLINDYGALYLSQKLLDDLTKHDANSKTITIKGKKGNPTEITEEMVQKMAERYSLSEKNKINLVLVNCVVKEGAFKGCMFIDNLTIDQGAKVEQYGFKGATITNLTINDGAIVESNGFHLRTITNLTINDGATVEEYGFIKAKITDLTINDGAIVEQYGFWEAKITDLTINDGATVEEDGFFRATITNLTINDGATVEEDGFWKAKITDLTINKGATVEENGFRQATIEKLIIDQGAVVNSGGFKNVTITDLTINDGATVEKNGFSDATITSTANISASVLIGDYGASDVPQKLLDELIKYDADNKTITVEGKEENPTEIINEIVQKMAQRYNLSEKNKINLVLKNCVVKECAFVKCKFIDNLTIVQGVTVEKYGFGSLSEGIIIKNLTINESAVVNNLGFSKATITNLTIKDGVTVENNGFSKATITNLTINENAKVGGNGFCQATIISTAKYDSGQGIQNNILTNWGFEQQ